MTNHVCTVATCQTLRILNNVPLKKEKIDLMKLNNGVKREKGQGSVEGKIGDVCGQQSFPLKGATLPVAHGILAMIEELFD